MVAKELEKVLIGNGWHYVRQTGSHKIYKKDSCPTTIAIPSHNNKDLPKGTLSAILKQADIKLF